jgi:sugar phosphate isomerase/epimerase
MILGGPLFGAEKDPVSWIEALKQNGYKAAYCPIELDTPDDVVAEYMRLAEQNGIVISEVGAWSNPISAVQEMRGTAISYCIERLELADRLGARCCCNTAGSRRAELRGTHPENFSAETFEMVVESVRTILDAVKPTRTYFALEMMPWIIPDSPDSYLDLIKAIDRERFAVHIDPVNIITSPRKYYYNADLLRECFSKLGPYIKSCHAKDITIASKHTVHLDVTIPGKGNLDYGVYLKEIAKLDRDMPLMMEYLNSPEEYRQAAAYIRKKAEEIGL